MSRRPHAPTSELRDLVGRLRSFGITNATIAKIIGITEKTLGKYYGSELAHGLEIAVSRVAESLYRKAVDGDTASMIFFLKTRAGWRERTEIDLSVEGTSPHPGVIILPAKFDTAEEWTASVQRGKPEALTASAMDN